jgi:hypothetical protein
MESQERFPKKAEKSGQTGMEWLTRQTFGPENAEMRK